MSEQSQINTPEIGYRWAMGAIKLAVEAGTPEILAYGARGVAKTLCLCDWLLGLCLDYPGMTQIWARSSRKRLSDGAIKTLEDEVLPLWGISLGSKDRDTRTSYQLPNGSEILLQGLDDPDRQKSVRADIVWVNEPSEITEAQWEEVGGSLRSSLHSRCPFRLLIGDHNPMPAAHWTFTRCAPVPNRLYPRVLDDGTRMAEWLTPTLYQDIQAYNVATLARPALTKKIIFCAADNPGYWSLDPWGWTPAGLEYARSRLGRMTGSRKARYLEGRPVAEEGVVFDDFDRDRHVIPRFDVPREWPVWVAYDPGYFHPCAVDFVAIAPNGQPFFVDEIHSPRIKIEELGPMIVERAKRYHVVRWLDDPRGANQETQAANGITARAFMHRFGLHFQPWKASQGPGKQGQVEAMREWLNRDKPLQIFEDCHGIISNFEMWKIKMNKKGELVEGDERYEDQNNDGIDGLMGIVADNPTPNPGEVRVYSQPV